MKTKNLLLGFLLAAIGITNAQVINYDNVKRYYQGGVKAIIENHEVKGYYVLLFLEKASGKQFTYSFNLLDQNMVKTHSVEITRDKRDVLLETAYNGTHFCLSYVNMKEKYLDYVILDRTGKQVGNYKVDDLSKTELGLYANAVQTDEEYVGGLSAVNGKGFIRYGIEKDKGWRFQMDMFDNAGKKKWSAGFDNDANRSYESGSPMFSNEKYVVTNAAVRNKKFTNDAEYFIQCNDPETGKQLFKVTLEDPKYYNFPLGVNYDENSKEFFVYGEFYKADKNPLSNNSEGFFVKAVDAATGTVKTTSYCSYTGDVAKLLPVNARGKMEDGRYFTIHTMMRTADGKIFAVAEQFKKAVSALGVAGALMGNRGTSLVKINLFDIMLFEFDPSMKLTKVHVYEKDKTSIELPPGLGIYKPSMLAYFLKVYGWFDYAFITQTSDKSQFSVAYTNYDRDKEDGNKVIVGTINYTKDKTLVVDKIPKNKKATQFIAIPAKPGYVAIFEYFRKKKTIEMRLEKLNL